MRNYERNSPQAAARIVVLALLADGEIHPVELTTLRNLRVPQRLGLGEEAFDAVIREFCVDVSRSTRIDADGHRSLQPAMVRKLFREVDDERLRLQIVRLVVEVIRADRAYHSGESVMLKTLLAAWQPRVKKRRTRRRFNLKPAVAGA